MEASEAVKLQNVLWIPQTRTNTHAYQECNILTRTSSFVYCSAASELLWELTPALVYKSMLFCRRYLWKKFCSFPMIGFGRNTRIIKQFSSNTSCFIVCEATCFGPCMTIIRPSTPQKFFNLRRNFTIDVNFVHKYRLLKTCDYFLSLIFNFLFFRFEFYTFIH